MSADITTHAEDTHKAQTRHFVDMAKRHADLAVDAPGWATSEATGSMAYVFAYIRVDCILDFPGGQRLTFAGNGIATGLGATGGLKGKAIFNVDPKTLKGASKITFEAWGLSIVGGGFQVNWYKDGKYIGMGAFYGVGISAGNPGGGWGSFS